MTAPSDSNEMCQRQVQLLLEAFFHTTYEDDVKYDRVKSKRLKAAVQEGKMMVIEFITHRRIKSLKKNRWIFHLRGILNYIKLGV